MEYDVFISYASEDEEPLVASLADILTKLGFKVWFAPDVLKIGDSLSRSIDAGLANARFGVAVLSKAYIAKPWPEYELRGLTSKAIGRDKVILPIWHDISRDEVIRFSPTLADAYALDTSKMSLNDIALKITEIVRPDIFKNLLRLKMWRKVLSEGERKLVPIKEVKHGPIRHKTLPENFLVRAKIIQHIFSDILSSSLENTINNFRRDLYPIEEIQHWEKLTATYLDATNGKNLSKEKRKDILKVLLGISVGVLNDENAQEFEHLTYDEVVEIVNLYGTVVPKVVDPKDEPD